MACSFISYKTDITKSLPLVMHISSTNFSCLANFTQASNALNLSAICHSKCICFIKSYICFTCRSTNLKGLHTSHKKDLTMRHWSYFYTKLIFSFMILLITYSYWTYCMLKCWKSFKRKHSICETYWVRRLFATLLIVQCGPLTWLTINLPTCEIWFCSLVKK